MTVWILPRSVHPAGLRRNSEEKMKRRPMRYIRPFEIAVLIMWCLCGLSLSQVNTASLTGLVTDQSHAVVPHVQVTITNTQTGYSRSAETDDAGYYSFQDLPIGPYRLSVSFTGFANMEQAVTVNTGEKIRR